MKFSFRKLFIKIENKIENKNVSNIKINPEKYPAIVLDSLAKKISNYQDFFSI